MYRWLVWIILVIIIGIFLGMIVLLRPLFRRINRGKYVIYKSGLYTREFLKRREESDGHINGEDLIELTEETANQLNPADRKWFEKNKKP